MWSCLTPTVNTAKHPVMAINMPFTAINKQFEVSIKQSQLSLDISVTYTEQRNGTKYAVLDGIGYNTKVDHEIAITSAI
jgi:hypothetical protein